MNLKLKQEVLSAEQERIRHKILSVKEERRRTGRLIAVLAGIMLFVVAIYHAWVRRIPVVASLVVPAIIMFLYVGWVLFSASKDKLKALNAAAAAVASFDEPEPFDVTVVPNTQKSPDIRKKSTADCNPGSEKGMPRPIILINDQLAEGQSIPEFRDSLLRFKGLPNKPKFKRKFCRRKRNAVLKRSYSIA